MKTTLKLILIYFGFQLLFTVLCVLFFGITSGSYTDGIEKATVWGLFLSSIALCLFLYSRNYLDHDKRTWSLNKPLKILLISLGLTIPTVLLYELFNMYVPIPDLMEEAFSSMNNQWIGILSIAIVGPIAEEFLFRGAIMRALMKQFSPTKAIVISALIFGIIHLNPAQVLFAFLLGLIFGWIYYKTGSLIPVILMHIVNNSFSTFLSVSYPEVDYTIELVGNTTYYSIIALAAVIFVICFIAFRQIKAVAWPNPEMAEMIPETEDIPQSNDE
ncbi:CPBP family intramembrane metalloprotease [Parabacteroides sp. OttesenSCG-928-G21]|nr:CPBP family intramembrane metalloprotease [Parabacteroides sp. OttesenSCG-928-G21]